MVRDVVCIAPSGANPENTTSLYRFDLVFVPQIAVASPSTRSNAAARTYAASTSLDHRQTGFAIAFM
jgi:hypothetical protein